MKLLVFCPYYPPHIGGLESHADEFNKYLSRKGVDIFVFTPRLPKDAPEYETKYSGVKIIRFPAFEIISNYPLPRFWNFRFWKLFFDLFKENPDIVISRTRFFVTSLMALKYAKLRRKKWIHIEHGSDFVRLSSRFKTFTAKIYDYTLGFLIFRFSDLNVSISKTVQKFVGRFDKRHSPVIYRGLDIQEIDKTKPDYELKEKHKDKIILVWAGRLYKWKGVENSVLAIKSLPKEIKGKIIFLIVGSGEDFAHLKKIVSRDSEIIMLGGLSREKVIGIFKISDIYLHSSHPGGGLSTSLLEAMYCGCTIIAMSNEGADEIIENNASGFLIEKSDTKLISEKLLEVFEKNTTKQKERAKNYIREKFNWGTSVEAYQQIFNKMMLKK